ncbi:MAG: imidazoleglycerol-phosphate dehydratase [Methanothrix sp.]
MRKGIAEVVFRGCMAKAELCLDGEGRVQVGSGSGFLDHMLTAFARTANIDLAAHADPGFYRIEALGRAMGKALDRSLEGRLGIRRYGWASVPMDESLADVALDFSGRPYLILSGEFRGQRIGDFDLQLLSPFLGALANEGRLTLHVRFYGENDHHKAESIFKALGFAIRQAAAVEGTKVPSTKGVI